MRAPVFWLRLSAACFVLFAVLIFVLSFDMQPIGPDGSSVGLATINGAVHEFVGVNWALYAITDWGGLVPIASMLVFFVVGLVQLVKGKGPAAVDKAVLLLGVNYAVMLGLFLLFNEVVINYRPVLVDGFLEPSFPSSTSLLAVGAFGPAAAWCSMRLTGKRRQAAVAACWVLAALLVAGRVASGVHWITDIVGGVLLGLALTFAYCGAVGCMQRNGGEGDGILGEAGPAA